MNRGEEAVNQLLSGFHCSQVVLAAFSEDYGLDTDLALRLACGFGGGMGCLGGACGALTGAYMVIGLKYGKTDPEDGVADRKTFGMVQYLEKEFTGRNGTTVCRELMKRDIITPEWMAKARDSGVFYNNCTKYVMDVIEILERIL